MCLFGFILCTPDPVSLAHFPISFLLSGMSLDFQSLFVWHEIEALYRYVYYNIAYSKKKEAKEKKKCFPMGKDFAKYNKVCSKM